MARDHSGCEVWQQDFLALDLPPARFDGVFANASLFHVPRSELPRVLGELHATLRPRGVLFASNPRGDDAEGWQGERYGVWHDVDAWKDVVTAAGFELLEHYYRPPAFRARSSRGSRRSGADGPRRRVDRHVTSSEKARMRTLLLLVVCLLSPGLVAAKVLNVEFKFTPYTGDTKETTSTPFPAR
jgi:SAM-dependent methyltransferase